MEDKYHNNADLSDYIDREMNLITPLFRLTRKSGIIVGVLLVISFLYSIYKLVSWGITMEDPFANISFGLTFVVLLIELDCVVCLFPAFFKKEYTLLRFILIFLFIFSIIEKNYVTPIITLWMFIALTFALKSENKARIKYAEHCSSVRISQSKEDNFIYRNPDLLVSEDSKNGFAPPIDNSNLFRKKSIYDEDIDLIDMDKVFKKTNDPEQ